MRFAPRTARGLAVFGSSGFGGCFLISLSTSLIGSAELILLLTHYVFTFIDPLRSLFSSFLGAGANILAPLFRASLNVLTRLTTGAGRIKNANQPADSHSRQEP